MYYKLSMKSIKVDINDYHNIEDLSYNDSMTMDNINDKYNRGLIRSPFENKMNVPLFGMFHVNGIYIASKANSLTPIIFRIAVWDGRNDRYIETNDLLKNKVSFYHRQDDKGEIRSSIIRSNKNMEGLSRVTGKRKVRDLIDVCIKTLNKMWGFNE